MKEGMDMDEQVDEYMIKRMNEKLDKEDKETGEGIMEIWKNYG